MLSSRPRVIPVPCLLDNYAYIVHAEGSAEAIVIDPSEAEPVIAELEREGLRLTAILNTHHHFDHVGGNEEILRRLGPVDVYAYVTDQGRVPGQTTTLGDGARFEAAGLAIQALHVPGHTLGAVSYLIGGCVFTGDTLFIAGCGRIFEGTPAQMFASLTRLSELDPQTQVYCGHEYTSSNLRFAAHVDPHNQAIADKILRVEAQRGRGEPTVGTTLAEELATNPFLRSSSAAMVGRYRGDQIERFAALRAEKDGYR